MKYLGSDAHKENARLARDSAVLACRAAKEERIHLYNLSPRLCEQCSNPIPYAKKSQNRFCSKSCGASFNNTRRSPPSMATRQKTSNALKGRKMPKREVIPFSKVSFNICTVCTKLFAAKVRASGHSRKTCSRTCSTYASTGSRSYQNGSRKPVKFFNPFENKEVLLESSWELKVAEHLISKNIKWIRPSYIKWTDSTDKERLYYPDFYLTDYDLYLDPKNPYCMKQDVEKMRIVSKSINLVFGHIDVILDKIDSLR